VIAEPPSAGAVHVSVADPFAAVAVPIAGALGTVGTVAVEKSSAAVPASVVTEPM